jgi:hypothetical protein
MVDTAQYDEILDPEINSMALARQIPSAKEIKRPVGHFAYVPECRWLIGRMLAAQLCSDPGKYPPAKPGALMCEPLKAAERVANAARTN